MAYQADGVNLKHKPLDSDTKASLIRVGNRITTKDLSYLKLLLTDYIDEYNDIKSGTKLFHSMCENQRLYVYDDLQIVVEAFKIMQRPLWLRELGEGHYDVTTPKISSYRQMVYNVAKNMTQSDMKDMKFLVSGESVPKMEMEKVTNPADLLHVLEEYGCFDESRGQEMESIFRSLTRKNAYRIYHEFYAKTAPSENICISGRAAQSRMEEISVKNVSPLPSPKASPSPKGSPKTLKYHPTEETPEPGPTIPTTVFTATFGSDDQGNDYNKAVCPEDTSNTQDGMMKEKESMLKIGLDKKVLDFDEGIKKLELSEKVLDTKEQHQDFYKMTARPRGYCLIINNEDFSKARQPIKNRNGTNVDRDNLNYIFNDILKFKTSIFDNQTSDQITKIMRDFALKDHSMYDAFVCCILSHGELDHIYGVDGNRVSIKDITRLFTGLYCRTLRDKPKIFVINACRGNDTDIGVQLEEDGPSPADAIPNEADFLIAYATSPGYKSFRSRDWGSWYISTLVDIMEQDHTQLDLLTMLVKVNNEVSKLYTKPDFAIYKQAPAPQFTIRKSILFS